MAPETAPFPIEQAVEQLLDAVCVVDDAGRFLYVSAAFERIFGYAPAEVIGRPMIELVWPEDRERTLRAAAEIMAGDSKRQLENRYLHKDGHLVDVAWSARWSPQHRARVAVAREITDLRRSESVQQARMALAEAVHAAPDLPALFAAAHGVLAALLPVAHCTVALFEPCPPRLQIAYRDPGQAPGPLAADAPERGLPVATGGVVARGEGWLGVVLPGDDEPLGVLSLQAPAGLAYGARERALLGILAPPLASAIERKQRAEQLHRLALYDTLTGLPRRELLQDRLERALAPARRDNTQVGLLYLDLDGFKAVNDRFGHEAGDALLRDAASRLSRALRGADTVARVGGDEFVVLVEQLRDPGQAAGVADKLLEALNAPSTVVAGAPGVRPSIGIALYPGDGEDPRALLRQADDAMYRAKRAGGNRAQLATPAG